MNRFDMTPLFRSTVGFDHLARLMDLAFETSTNDGGYPPYNIEKLSDDRYRITMAVAGFEQDDIALTQTDNVLVVKAASKADAADATREFLHRGIAARQFQRSFVLADGVEVAGAYMEHGLLHIDLRRHVPESVVQTIAIGRKG